MNLKKSYHQIAEIGFIFLIIVSIIGIIFYIIFQGDRGATTGEKHLGLTQLYQALEDYSRENDSFYEPDMYTSILAGNIFIAGQAFLEESDLQALGLDTSEFSRGDRFGYSFNRDFSQAMVFLENTRNPKLQQSLGDALGIYYYDEEYLAEVYPGLGVDIFGENSGHVFAYFPDIESTIRGEKELFSHIYNRDPLLLSNPNLANLDESLELYLDMETIGTSGRMIDLSGNKRHGLCFDANKQVICGNGGPKISLEGAFVFDGLDDYIELDTNFPLSASPEGYSIVVRARLSESQLAALTHENTLLGNFCSTKYVFGQTQERGQKEEYKGFSLQITDEKLEYIDSFHEQAFEISQEDSESKEYFVVLSFDAQDTIANIWLARGDGELILSSYEIDKSMFTSSACPLRIAKNYGHTSLYDNFDGKIYDVRVYSRPLTQSEAESIYKSGR